MEQSLNKKLIHEEASFTKRYHVSESTLVAFRKFAVAFLLFDYLIFFIAYTYMAPVYMLQFLTEWSCLCTTLYFIYAVRQNRSEEQMAIFLHICLAAEFLVVIFYWVVIFRSAIINDFLDLYLAITKHSCPFMFLIIEYILNTRKLEAHSIKFGMVFMVAYMFNNFLFMYVFEINIYKVITWKGKLTRPDQLRIQAPGHQALPGGLGVLPCP